MRVKVQPVIRIGIYPYSVSLVKHLKLHQGCWGVSNHILKTIELDEGLDDLERMQTLTHEVLHIISNNYRCSMDEDDTERIANGFCEYLIGMGIELDWSDIHGV